MSFFRRLFLTLIAIGAGLGLSISAAANGYILGGGVDADSASGRALTIFGDFGITEKTWLSGSLSAYETETFLGRRQTDYMSASIDHWMDPIGVRAGASYWGNRDILDSVDFNGSVYYRDESFMFSADYERREFDFIVFADSDVLRRTAEFSATGLGLSSRFSVSENVSMHLGGIVYDYSRDIRLQPDIDSLRVLSFSRLSMVNSLVDHRFDVGVELRKGLRSIDLTAGSWQTAVDGGRVDSFSIGYLAPINDRTDGEIRFSFDDSENFGETMAISVYVYFFGGS